MFINPLRSTIIFLSCLIIIFQISCVRTSQSQVLEVQNRQINLELAVDLNTATIADLEKLPKIGNGIAKRIVEYREKNGNFRRPEHLILVRGMSDKKFRELQNLVKVE